jgi:hypothetical protein
LFYVLFVSIVLFYLLFVSIVLFYLLFVSIVLFYLLFVSIVLFYVLFVCKCVPYYCHRVSTQLQLTNISYQLPTPVSVASKKSIVFGHIAIPISWTFSCTVTAGRSYKISFSKLKKFVMTLRVKSPLHSLAVLKTVSSKLYQIP